MSTELIINASLPETRIALVENGEIQDLVIERPSDKGIVGNIYKGRVTRVLPGMQAAFVDIGLDKAAFLYVDEVYVHQNVFEEEASQAEAAANEARSTLAGLNDSTPSASDEGSASPAEASEDAGFSESQNLSQEDEPQANDDSTEPSDESALSAAEAGAASGGESEDVSQSFEESPSESDAAVSDSSDGSDDPAPADESETMAQEGQVEVEAASEGETVQSTSGESTASGDASQAGGAIRFQRDSRRHRRGRRGGRGRRRHQQDREATNATQFPKDYEAQLADSGTVVSDRAAIADEGTAGGEDTGKRNPQGRGQQARRPEFREQRSRDRRVRPKSMMRPSRGQVNIQDLLQEGQEVLVQVAKDPIATKGARLTCHISLPGRHLVCMPTIDHVGVSRRIDRDDERRKLRDLVERFRPQNLGFIVRTASASGKNSEKRVRQDIDYLANLWGEIRENASSVSAPALVYEDLNPILRAIRDWVNEDIDKIVVDSRYHYNEILKFISHFMPVLKSKVELYHGDIPIFDAYNISTELSRSLERRVWLKSGGYIMIDQAEALVAIDVNTGRFVGKRNLEDTILKTNLEAVQEIAYQLRLRNCGGIIILDLIDMEKEENRHRVYRALEEALKRDRARPTIQKISDLGLIEMTRKRTRDTMVRTLCEPCSHCEGKGFVKSKITVSYEVLREIEREGIERDVGKILVQAHPDVIDILAIDHRDTLDGLERRYRKQIYLQAVIDYHVEQFEVFSEKKENQRKMRDDQQRRHQQQQRQQGGERSEHRRDERKDRSKENRQNDNAGSPEYDELQTQRARAAASLEEANAAADVRANDDAADDSAPAGNDSIGNPDGASLGSMERQAGDRSSRSPQDDEDFSEEDRLAFLRAQAAQDAALAKFSAGGNAVPGRPTGGGGQGGGGGHGGGGGGGRRGRNNHRRGGQGGKNFGRGGQKHGGGGRWSRGQGGGGERAPQQAQDTRRDSRNNDDDGGDRSPPPAPAGN